MIAISILNQTVYDYNLLQTGSNLTAVIENLFSRDSSKNHSHVALGRYLKIAIIIGPALYTLYCNDLARFQIDSSNTASDWLIFEERQFDWLTGVVSARILNCIFYIKLENETKP